jgi:hypothetical protein
MLCPTIAAVALAVAALVATNAGAQPAAERRPTGKQADAADAYGEMLRRTDADAHARYVRLRAARDASLAELNRAQDRYRSAGPELRAVSLPQMRAARKKYAADEGAFLDFLDERDRKTLEQYRAATEQINRLLEQRARAREDLRELTKE